MLPPSPHLELSNSLLGTCFLIISHLGSAPPDSSAVTICLQCRRPWFESWLEKIPWRRDRLPTPVFLDFPRGSDSRESACNAGDQDSIPELGRSPREGNGNPLQHSYLHAFLPTAIYSPWNSPGQNIGVGSHSPFSRGSSQPRDRTQVSHISSGFFTS